MWWWRGSAVSAHLEEFDDQDNSEEGSAACSVQPGHAARVAALLADPVSRVWPPASVQQLANRKSRYLLKAGRIPGVAIAPTEVLTCPAARRTPPPPAPTAPEGAEQLPLAAGGGCSAGSGGGHGGETAAAGQDWASELGPRAVLAAAERRGWRRFVVKPVPSKWSCGMDRFETAALRQGCGGGCGGGGGGADMSRLREFFRTGLVANAQVRIP